MQFVKTFFVRQSVYPFEVMWAFVCMFLGLVAVLNYGVTTPPLNTALGATTAMIFNVIFFVAGAGMFFGIGFGKGNIEAFGLILLITSLLVRTIASGWFFGIDPMAVNGYILNLGFVVACAVRLKTILGWTVH